MRIRLGMAWPWGWAAWRAIGDADILAVWKNHVEKQNNKIPRGDHTYGVAMQIWITDFNLK